MASRSSSDPSKKPSPVVVGRSTAYAVRRPSASDERWYWQAKGAAIDGQRPTLWSGRATPDEVAEILAKIVVEHGVEPEAEVVREARAIAAGLTVAELIARWWAHVEATPDKYAANTRRNYEGQARRLTEDVGGYRLTELRPAMLERYHSLRIAKGARKGTADLSLRVLRTAWNWGLRNKLHRETWPKPSIRLRDRSVRERPQMDEVERVLALMRQDAPTWAYRLARIVGHTGMRVSECWGLMVGDVVIDRKVREVIGGCLEIREGEGVAKTGARSVFMAPALAEEIAGWLTGRGGDERLIGTITQQTAVNGAANYLRPAAQKIGATWTGWHSFRRAAADAYAEAGVDPVVAAAQLGHTVAEMQSTYRSVRDEQRQAAASAVDAGRTVRAPLHLVKKDSRDG